MFDGLFLHIPHASARIPDEYLADYPADIDEEIRLMTDWYTDELFDISCERIVFPVSRLVCDVERFRDDAREVMAPKGMGAVYTKRHDGTRLRSVTQQKREAILKRYYDPHHGLFTEKTDSILCRQGKCLIVDCHSFYPVPLPHEPNQRGNRPDICIGTDAYHTPQGLTDKLTGSFREMGYTVGVNMPFSGTIVPEVFYQNEKRVISVMIEINRALYLERDGAKASRFSKLKKDIERAIGEISEQDVVSVHEGG